ncbi:MAG: hypothetical protein JXB48_12570 [Candidatus Latescibacteria bacterium]|nr:hypothetical protein [Candidatus Latescibacterota bacterium]
MGKTLAIASGMGTVTVGNIKNGDFILNDYGAQFSYPCKKYYSLRDGSLIWGFGLRDFYIADLVNGTVKEELASHNGNERIVQMDVLDRDKPTLYVEITKTNWGEYIQRELVYDPVDKKSIDTINDYKGELFLLPNGNILFEKFNGSLPATWKIGKGFKTGLKDNLLTDKLNDAKVYVWSISYSYQNNLMIGFNTINDKDIYYVIKWDDNFEDVSIEPFSFQRDPDRYLWDHFEISQDGKWAKTVSKLKKSDQRTDDITFYAVNDSFPQSLSPPVYGGRSTRDGGGCFLETDDWGTVYVDISPEAPGYLAVYKMSDVMNKVVEKMRNLKL